MFEHLTVIFLILVCLCFLPTVLCSTAQSNVVYVCTQLNGSSVSTAVAVPFVPLPSSFPQDYFSTSQLQHGAFVLHAIAMIFGSYALLFIEQRFLGPALMAGLNKMGMQPGTSYYSHLLSWVFALPLFFVCCLSFWEAQNDLAWGAIAGTVIIDFPATLITCTAAASGLTLQWYVLFSFSNLIEMMIFMLSLCVC